MDIKITITDSRHADLRSPCCRRILSRIYKRMVVHKPDYFLRDLCDCWTGAEVRPHVVEHRLEELRGLEEWRLHLLIVQSVMRRPFTI
jgi:hypothetical protein